VGWGWKIDQAPEWRKKSFQILFHIFHPVLFEERLDLFLEGHLPMVFGLTSNVFCRVLDTGEENNKSSGTFKVHSLAELRTQYVASHRIPFAPSPSRTLSTINFQRSTDCTEWPAGPGKKIARGAWRIHIGVRRRRDG
jgi:hypothetical protein